jgi:hypothetical protein
VEIKELLSKREVVSTDRRSKSSSRINEMLISGLLSSR